MSQPITNPVNVSPNNSVKPPAAAPPMTGANPAISQNTQAFHSVLHRMLSVDPKISDLIFSPGRPPQVELTGDLQGVQIAGLERLTPPQIKAMADLMLLRQRAGLGNAGQKRLGRYFLQRQRSVPLSRQYFSPARNLRHRDARDSDEAAELGRSESAARRDERRRN